MKARLEQVQPVLGTRDVARAIGFFRRLGFTPSFVDSPTAPRYAALRRDAVEIHVQWHDAAGRQEGDRPTYRFLVPEVDALSAEFGFELDRTELRDTPWGTREFHVRDLDGNGLHFYRPR